MSHTCRRMDVFHKTVAPFSSIADKLPLKLISHSFQVGCSDCHFSNSSSLLHWDFFSTHFLYSLERIWYSSTSPESTAMAKTTPVKDVNHKNDTATSKMASLLDCAFSFKMWACTLCPVALMLSSASSSKLTEQCQPVCNKQTWIKMACS